MQIESYLDFIGFDESFTPGMVGRRHKLLLQELLLHLPHKLLLQELLLLLPHKLLLQVRLLLLLQATQTIKLLVLLTNHLLRNLRLLMNLIHAVHFQVQSSRSLRFFSS